MDITWIDIVTVGAQLAVALGVVGVVALVGRETFKQVAAFLLTIYGFIRAAVDDKNDLAIRLAVKMLHITADQAIQSADIILDTLEKELKAAQEEATPKGG